MKKIKLTITLVIVLLFSIVFVGCNNDMSDNPIEMSNAYIILDINPSIEIITNDEGKVEQVNGLNDDGIKLLIDTDYTNLDVDFVVDEILNLALEYGYINFDVENAILITTSMDTVEESNAVENIISKQIQDFIDKRKIKMDILKASFDESKDIIELAKEYQVSVGKIKLITHAMFIDSELTFEEAVSMPIKELNKIIKEDRKEVREFFSEEIRNLYKKEKELLKKEFFVEARGLIFNKMAEVEDEIFLNLSIDSNISIDEIKELYQEYYNALVNARLAEEDRKNEEERNNIEDLKKEYDKLIIELKALRISKDYDLNQMETLLNQIKELVVQMREIEQNNGFKGRGYLNNNRVNNSIREIYKDIEREYKKKFIELGLELEVIEEFFMDMLEEEINGLRLNFEDELLSIHESFMMDSNALRVQLKEEKEILRNIWK